MNNFSFERFSLVDATKYWDLNIAEECIGQTNITFPDTTTVIESGTFETCSNSQSVTIPRSVTEIGTYAFYNCSGLTSITSLATTAPQLGVAAFEMVNDTIPVYIPCGSLQSYRSAWPHFSNFVDALFVSTSAACVTGLSPFNTFDHWNLFGQIVILVLIQIGGLGFVTVLTLKLFLIYSIEDSIENFSSALAVIPEISSSSDTNLAGK